MTEELVVLKNGEVTRDRRLDRIHQIDLRSLNYSVADALTAPYHQTPRSRTWTLRDSLDQGQEGSCVGHGWAHELAATPIPVPNMTHEYAVEKIYWEAQKIDDWEGGSYPDADPRYEGTSVLAGAKICQSLGFIDEYRWALSLDDLVLALGHLGPAVIGVEWFEGMFDTDEKGFIHPTGRRSGGHCLCIIGVAMYRNRDRSIDYTRSYFILQNSWGPSWGKNGRCYLTLAEMMVLWPSGDFCIPVTRTKS